MMRTLIPCMVNGNNVEIDEDSLVKKTGGHENDNEIADWTEYWLDGVLVHRSAHVHLKNGVGPISAAGIFS